MGSVSLECINQVEDTATICDNCKVFASKTEGHIVAAIPVITFDWYLTDRVEDRVAMTSLNRIRKKKNEYNPQRQKVTENKPVSEAGLEKSADLL